MDRQHRRELKHDRFVDEIGSLSHRAQENQRFLLTLGVAALAIAVAVYGVFFYRSGKEKKAQDALAVAIETIDSPLIPAPGSQTPVPPTAKYKTEAERTAAAEKLFRDVQKNFGGTDAYDVANLYLARIEAGRGEVASARKRLQAFIDDHPKHFLVWSARYSLYQLRIENGEAAQVVRELDAELKKTENQALPADTMLILEAHAYDAQGASDKSRETYNRIIREYPDSSYVIEAQRRVGTQQQAG